MIAEAKSMTKAPKPHPPKTRGINYDAYWLNKELRTQIDIIKQTKNICTQIQLYQYLDYSKDKFSYWIGQKGSNTLTQDLLKKRNELFEARLIEAGFRGNPAFPIFLLKNHYGYQDKREVTTDNNYTFTVNRGLPTPQQQRKLVKTQVNKKA